MDTHQPRPLLVLGLVATVVAGAFGGALYVALTFGGSGAAPRQAPTSQVAAVAPVAVATVTVTKAAKVHHHKAKVAKKTTTTTHAKALLTVKAQDVPADPAPSDTSSTPPPLNGGGGGAGVEGSSGAPTQS